MSDVYFKCMCGKSLAVDERGIGQTVPCADCGNPVEVPEPEIEFDCENCGATLLAPASIQGDRIKCTVCAHRMIAPSEPVGGIAGTGVNTPVFESSSLLFRWAMPTLTLVCAVVLVCILIRGSDDAPSVVSERRVERKVPEMVPVDLSESVVAAESEPAAPGMDLIESAMPSETSAITLEEKECAGETALLDDDRVTQVKTLETTEALPREIDTDLFSDRDPAAAPSEAAAKNAGLMSELHAVDKLRLSGKREEFHAALESWRSRINEFTRTHSGKALDHIEWGIPFQTCYEWSNEHLCGSYEEAERLVREAIGMLMASAPEDERLAPRISLYLTVKHGHRWVQVAPGRCAALLDEIEEMAPWSDDPDLHRYWSFLVPILESNFLCYADRLPDGEREEFYAQRERKLLMYLRDERIPLEWRTRYAWSRAGRLERIGEMRKAAALLENFWRENDGEIHGAEFYNLRLWVALFGEGDWQKASDILSRATSLAGEWAKPFHVRQFKDMTEAYYRHIFLPGYELQRQQTILTAQQRGGK